MYGSPRLVAASLALALTLSLGSGFVAVFLAAVFFAGVFFTVIKFPTHF
jgi:hypothetical protein